MIEKERFSAGSLNGNNDKPHAQFVPPHFKKNGG
jgi:hypothetical protein